MKIHLIFVLVTALVCADAFNVNYAQKRTEENALSLFSQFGEMEEENESFEEVISRQSKTIDIPFGKETTTVIETKNKIKTKVQSVKKEKDNNCNTVTITTKVTEVKKNKKKKKKKADKPKLDETFETIQTIQRRMIDDEHQEPTTEIAEEYFEDDPAQIISEELREFLNVQQLAEFMNTGRSSVTTTKKSTSGDITTTTITTVTTTSDEIITKVVTSRTVSTKIKNGKRTETRISLCITREENNMGTGAGDLTTVPEGTGSSDETTVDGGGIPDTTVAAGIPPTTVAAGIPTTTVAAAIPPTTVAGVPAVTTPNPAVLLATLPQTTYQGKLYYFYNIAKLSWAAAETTCSSLGLKLVSIESEGENDALFIAMMQINGLYGKMWWTSGNDIETENTFKWTSTGQLFGPYIKWAPGQPDNQLDTGTGTNENCVSVGMYDSQVTMAVAWKDEQCSSTLYSICETP